MPAQRLNRILCAADPRGDIGAIERLLSAAADQEADALAVVGDLAEGGARASHRKVLSALAASRLPTFVVPGPGDAPVAFYLREVHDAAIARPDLHGVHGTAAVAPDGHLVFAGLGGEIDDDPEGPRDEEQRLRYPRWEAEYRTEIVAEFDGQQPVLLFTTPPAHKGTGPPGSEVLAELVATYRARLVVCGGERNTGMLGRTLVVAPGSLGEGRFAVADLSAREARLCDLAATA
ncbi:MAG: uncharacterized protein QOG77_291 [Solirubrobacteraceae bacterium]|jgi:Icc-related predicted phosphoesterase|nr:uncharacterized protein [Solirubrobacteraceae bacterium]